MLLKYLPPVLLFFIFLLSCETNKNPAGSLNEEHFEIILYGRLSSSAVSDISRELEENYQRILDDLQVSDMPQTDVKIWADYNDFLDAMENDTGTRYTGATGYIYGMTECRIYYTQQAPLTAVHEFAHLVSMQVNSTIPNNPRWLWEAATLYVTNDFTDPRTLPYMVSGNYPSLSELNTDYNSSGHQIYSVGYVLLEYIVDTWGMDSVIRLIETNGNIPLVLGITAHEFESGWHQFVEETYLN